MMDFDDTFNMVFGVKNASINWFDNPYLSMNVYETKEDWKPYLSPNIKLQNCTKDQMLTFVTETSLQYYPNSLCFVDKRPIKIIGNWFDNKFHNPFVSIESCNNATYHGKCKS